MVEICERMNRSLQVVEVRAIGIAWVAVAKTADTRVVIGLPRADKLT